MPTQRHIIYILGALLVVTLSVSVYTLYLLHSLTPNAAGPTVAGQPSLPPLTSYTVTGLFDSRTDGGFMLDHEPDHDKVTVQVSNATGIFSGTPKSNEQYQADLDAYNATLNRLSADRAANADKIRALEFPSGTNDKPAQLGDFSRGDVLSVECGLPRGGDCLAIRVKRSVLPAATGQQ